jgi:hypothetical protein
MASITSNTLSEHDALRLILDCKKSGRSLDHYLHITNLNKNNITDLPAAQQKALTTYAKTNTIDVILINK